MIGVGWAFPVRIMDHHICVEEALHALSRDFSQITVNPRSRFWGKLREEFDSILQDELKEQDNQTVMMLVASCEAIFRLDYKARAMNPRNRKAPPDSEFREIYRDYEMEVRLDSIFDIWKSATQGSKLFGELRKLMKLRHWLAHGRYWTNKSGVTTDPRLTMNLIQAVFQVNQAYSPDFPRSL